MFPATEGFFRNTQHFGCLVTREERLVVMEYFTVSAFGG